MKAVIVPTPHPKSTIVVAPCCFSSTGKMHLASFAPQRCNIRLIAGLFCSTYTSSDLLCSGFCVIKNSPVEQIFSLVLARLSIISPTIFMWNQSVYRDTQGSYTDSVPHKNTSHDKTPLYADHCCLFVAHPVLRRQYTSPSPCRQRGAMSSPHNLSAQPFPSSTGSRSACSGSTSGALASTASNFSRLPRSARSCR